MDTDQLAHLARQIGHRSAQVELLINLFVSPRHAPTCHVEPLLQSVVAMVVHVFL